MVARAAGAREGGRRDFYREFKSPRLPPGRRRTGPGAWPGGCLEPPKGCYRIRLNQRSESSADRSAVRAAAATTSAVISLSFFSRPSLEFSVS